jgi:hypothetical protein
MILRTEGLLYLAGKTLITIKTQVQTIKTSTINKVSLFKHPTKQYSQIRTKGGTVGMA